MRLAAAGRPRLERARWLLSGFAEVRAARRIVSDRRSLWRLLRLRLLPFTWRGRAPSAVPLRIRGLADRVVWVRPRTADVYGLLDVFLFGHNEPPPGLDHEAPLVIYDLGANIGLTMAHLAVLFPNAVIVGVEMQEENIMQARHNLAQFGHRCRLVTAAVWKDDGVVRYRAGRGDEQSARAGHGADLGADVRAVSISTLMREQGHLRVDFLKMDIEGAEREILSGSGEWASSVSRIKIEVHEPYTTEACMEDLRRLSYRVDLVSGHPASLVGRR